MKNKTALVSDVGVFKGDVSDSEAFSLVND